MPKVGMEPVRRRALIAATIDAIHERGVGQVTMGDIARRAGVSAGLAHHYFGAKDQLLLATMRHLLAELSDQIQARLAEASTPMDRIRAIIRGNFASCQFQPAVISAWLAFYNEAQHNGEARRLLRVYTRRLESNLLHELAELTDRPHAERLAEATASMIDGVWIRRSLADGDPASDDAAQMVEDMVANALRKSRA